MIDSIIYSFDRSCQLHLLLESIEKNANNIFNLNVVYKYSDKKFKEGYEILKSRFINVNFIEEKNFKEQTLELLELFNSDLMCFFTDDDIIYNPIFENDIIDSFNKDENMFCFSLRLGKNVTYCYTLNSSNVLLVLRENNKVVFWNWKKHYADFGYPISVDGHIFKRKEISKLIRKVSFFNPNTLEGNLQIFDNYPKEIMCSYQNSSLVNSPNNIVNETHPNRKGEKFSFSSKELNDKYLNKEIIDYSSIDFSKIVGCHQELCFGFKLYDKI